MLMASGCAVLALAAVIAYVARPSKLIGRPGWRAMAAAVTITCGLIIGVALVFAGLIG
jgi:hypothetical protein